MIERVRARQSAEELARKFEPSAAAIRNWVVWADRDEGHRSDGVTSEERMRISKQDRYVENGSKRAGHLPFGGAVSTNVANTRPSASGGASW